MKSLFTCVSPSLACGSPSSRAPEIGQLRKMALTLPSVGLNVYLLEMGNRNTFQSFLVNFLKQSISFFQDWKKKKKIHKVSVNYIFTCITFTSYSLYPLLKYYSLKTHSDKLEVIEIIQKVYLEVNVLV